MTTKACFLWIKLPPLTDRTNNRFWITVNKCTRHSDSCNDWLTALKFRSHSLAIGKDHKIGLYVVLTNPSVRYNNKQNTGPEPVSSL